jgi:hypothetical protein|tara:strand:+ start:172 stop:528 length:357 start_codon:yes stop_codon:yes gene_type:complete
MANTFVNKKADLTSDATVTLYTVPTATTAIIKSILVSTDHADGSTITITITDEDDAVFSITYLKLIEGAQGASGDPVEVLTNPLVAETGEIIKVAATNANRLHVILSALEIKPREVTT